MVLDLNMNSRLKNDDFGIKNDGFVLKTMILVLKTTIFVFVKSATAGHEVSSAYGEQK